ncbi:MAG TPA: ATP-binding protein [Clostridia bacterium]|nr:ATP-binding protein [Clostridia bacterium]
MNKKVDPGTTIITIIIINLTQIALIAAVLLYLVENGGGPGLLANPWIIVLLTVTLAAVVINSLAAFKNRSSLLRSVYQFQLLEDTLGKLEKLNNSLRAQRHDFMNHLQVVHSLIEMDEYKSASEYIEKVYTDIQKVSRVMKTSNAAVNALLQAKLLTCEKHGINVELNVTTQLKDLRIESWEFCRILGNLIDNAVYALSDKQNEKQIRIELSEDLRNYCFKVTDNGTPIPPQVITKIFVPGFTTKGEGGEGMGLAICREILENYGGTISVASDESCTTFSGSIPR